MKGLTEKQRNILEFIEDFMEVNMMAPTVYEIAAHFGIKTSTVFAHVRSLQKKNYLTRSSKARSITLRHPQKKNRRPAGLRSVPLYESLQSVTPAGERLPRKNSTSQIYCDGNILKSDKELRKLFAVRVREDSLRESGILNGDIAIMKRPSGEVREGDIVLMRVNGRNEFRAYPGKSVSGEENFILPQNYPVEGVMIGLQRSL